VALVVGSASVVAAQGGEAGAGSEAWYKVVTGVIGIPAAVVALAIAVKVLRKTTLESRKLELEIVEKQKTLGEEFAKQGLQDFAKPIGDTQRALLLVVRFAVLELTLRLWAIVPAAFGQLTGSVPYVLFFIGGEPMMERLGTLSAPVMGALAATKAIDLAFDVVYWSIVFGFGWPLLKDTCTFLGIEIKSVFDLPFIGRRSGRASAS
jgi:hypothetical protein